MNENNIDFVPDLDVARTASLPKKYETGAFRVTIESINANITNDGHPTISFKLKRLDGCGYIELNRIFLEEQPYGMPELSFDAVHDFLELMGIEDITVKLHENTFDITKFRDELSTSIGKQFIVLVFSEYTIKNNTTYVNTKLRMAYDKDGLTLVEHERPNLKRNGQLQFIGKRLVPSATRSYMNEHGAMPNDKINMNLLINEFSHLYTDKELDNFKNGLCGRAR